MRLILFYNVAAQLAREGGFPLEEAYSKIRGMGYTGIDPLVWGETGEDLIQFRRRAESCGVDVPACSAMTPLYSDKDLDVCRRFVDSAAALGARSAMLLPAPCPSDVAREEARDILAGYLSKLCDYSEGCGVTLSVENFSRISCPFSRADDLVYLLSSVPKLMMTFDTGNFIWVNESPSEAIDKILAIRKQPFSHVHMKNYSRERYNEYPEFNGRDLNGAGFYSYPCIGGGMADLAYICLRLKDIGYDGCVSVENGGIFPAEPALSDSAKWLRENLGI